MWYIWVLLSSLINDLNLILLLGKQLFKKIMGYDIFKLLDKVDLHSPWHLGTVQ